MMKFLNNLKTYAFEYALIILLSAVALGLIGYIVFPGIAEVWGG